MTCPHCDAPGQHELASLRCGSSLYSEVIRWLNKERDALRTRYCVVLATLRPACAEDSRPIEDLRRVIHSLPDDEQQVSPYDVVCLATAISAGPLEPCYWYALEDGTTIGDYVRREILRPLERIAGLGSHLGLLRVARIFPSLWPDWRQESLQ